MATIRVPYPINEATRRIVFERAEAKLERHGSLEGTPEGGRFQSSTPIGKFAGQYRSPSGADFLEIELTEKPWLVPLMVVENEVRKFLAQI